MYDTEKAANVIAVKISYVSQLVTASTGFFEIFLQLFHTYVCMYDNTKIIQGIFASYKHKVQAMYKETLM